jgi:hypothetical protein
MCDPSDEIFAAEVGYDWAYFRIPDLITPEMVPYGNDTFELIVVVRALLCCVEL